MFVGLLKWPKNSLESEQPPTAPWPRYSRELTFRHYRPRPFRVRANLAGLVAGLGW